MPRIRRRRQIATLLSGAALAALGAAPGAQATTTVSLSPDGTTLQLAGDGLDSTVQLWPQTFGAPPTTGQIEVTNFVFDNDLAAGAGCTSGTTGSRVHIRCAGLTTDPAVRRVTGALGGGADSFSSFVFMGGGVVLDGGDGSDSLDAFNGNARDASPQVATLTGGLGSDTLTGDGQGDTLDGGPGIDTLRGHGGGDDLAGGDDGDQLIGDAGTDTLDGDGGPDSLQGGADGDDLDGGAAGDALAGDGGDDDLTGGPGDDRFEAAAGAATPTTGSDVIAGGPGRDEMSYASMDYDVLSVTLDDVANDGEVGATPLDSERDNVGSDVEDVTSSQGDRATLVGTDAPNVLRGLGAVSNAITGGGGDDVLVGSFGVDTVDGGAGEDEIRTGDAADVITGGPDADEIHADICGPGTCAKADRIDVVDGVRDEVFCGGVGDVVRADAVDNLLLCDNVTTVGGTQNQQQTGTGGSQASSGQQTVIQPAPVNVVVVPPRPTPVAVRRCRVPSLRGLTLTRAVARLRAAGCARGRVRRPRGVRASRLRVSRQSRRAGTLVAHGTKVDLTLTRRATRSRRG